MIPSWFDYQDPEDAREPDSEDDVQECEHGEEDPRDCTLCVLGDDR
jgi:hypothetical protein